MPNPIIQVSNLSKSYTISHEGKERYTALPKKTGQVRDVMAQKVKKIFSFPSSLRACPVHLLRRGLSSEAQRSGTDTVDKLRGGVQ